MATTPVTQDDVVQGCWKWLVEGKWCPPLKENPTELTDIYFPDNLLSDYPPLGHYPGLSPYTYYIFQDHLYVNLEGSGDNAVVISYAGPWGGPVDSTTWNFPRVSLEIFCDSLRNTDYQVMPAPGSVYDPGNPPNEALSYNTAHAITPAETRLRLMAIYHRFDKYLHRPQGGVQWWGSLRTVSSSRIGEIVITPVPDGGGMLRGQVFYAVIVG